MVKGQPIQYFKFIPFTSYAFAFLPTDFPVEPNSIRPYLKGTSIDLVIAQKIGRVFLYMHKEK